MLHSSRSNTIFYNCSRIQLLIVLCPLVSIASATAVSVAFSPCTEESWPTTPLINYSQFSEPEKASHFITISRHPKASELSNASHGYGPTYSVCSRKSPFNTTALSSSSVFTGMQENIFVSQAWPSLPRWTSEYTRLHIPELLPTIL